MPRPSARASERTGEQAAAGRGPTDAVPLPKKGFGLMTEVLGMPAPYYSFDHGGWHVISLNSLCNWPSYATLSDEHFAWLVNDL